jgi:hypothetical protein
MKRKFQQWSSTISSGVLEFIPLFSGVRVTRSLVLCACFVDRFLSFCPFFWPKCYLSVFDLWIPITPLVSSNSSYINKTSIHLPHIHLTCCFPLALATACRRGELQPYHVVESCIRCAVDRSSVSLFTNASILTKNRLPEKRFWVSMYSSSTWLFVLLGFIFIWRILLVSDLKMKKFFLSLFKWVLAIFLQS